MIDGTLEKPTKINPKSELKGTHAAKKKRINLGTIKKRVCMKAIKQIKH